MEKRINLRSTSDGWRGKMAESFTFDFVERVALAIGEHILNQGGNKTFIGYDTRFLSADFAMRAGQIMCEIGVEACISSNPIPTPVVSFKVNREDMICGITITASHNPYYYNGIKVRMGYGGAPSDEFSSKIGNRINSIDNVYYDENFSLQGEDCLDEYCKRLKKVVNPEIFKRRSMRIAVDTMHGTTTGILKNFFSGTRTEILEIHSDLDPYFGGISPEPMESTTQELQKMVFSEKLSLGIAHDGDGDRIMAFLPKIGYI